MISPELVVDAIVFSNFIAMLSLGLTLTYMTLKVPNFAHGDSATIGTYVAFTLFRLYGINPYAALPPAFLVGGAVALLSYLLVYRPLSNRGATVVIMMVASMALEIIIRSSLHIYADTMTYTQKTFFRGFIFRDSYLGTFLGVNIPLVALTSSLFAIVTAIVLYVFLRKTKFGVALRASIENPSLASTLGINVNLTYAFSWFLAGGLAGASGVFLPYRFPSDPEVGWGFLLRIFAASVLGGLDNIFGAILGGYITGVAEVLGTYVLSRPPLNLSPAYRPAIPFTILILVLLVIPRGITSINLRRIKGVFSGG